MEALQDLSSLNDHPKKNRTKHFLCVSSNNRGTTSDFCHAATNVPPPPPPHPCHGGFTVLCPKKERECTDSAWPNTSLHMLSDMLDALLEHFHSTHCSDPLRCFDPIYLSTVQKKKSIALWRCNGQ